MVASLPHLPVKKQSFNIIICLEVLYYLDQRGLEESLERIRSSLEPDGYFLLSGVLDGGRNYFAEEELKELVLKSFNIVDETYGHSRIYGSVEKKLLHMMSKCQASVRISRLENGCYDKWLYEKKVHSGKLKSTVLQLFSFQVPREIAGWILDILIVITRSCLSFKIPVIVLNKLSKILNLAVGILYFSQSFLVNILDPSSCEDIFSGPNIFILFF